MSRAFSPAAGGVKQITAIPEPGEDLASVRETVVALKQVLEAVLGLRGSAGPIYLTVPGDAAPTASKKGELWIIRPVKDGDAWVISVWTGIRWEKM